MNCEGLAVQVQTISHELSVGSRRDTPDVQAKTKYKNLQTIVQLHVNGNYTSKESIRRQQSIEQPVFFRGARLALLLRHWNKPARDSE